MSKWVKIIENRKEQSIDGNIHTYKVKLLESSS